MTKKSIIAIVAGIVFPLYAIAGQPSAQITHGPYLQNLSEDEVRQITRFRRGEGLLCIGYNHVPIAFHASQREYDAITTSPTDLRSRQKED